LKEGEANFTDINHLIYAAATVTERITKPEKKVKI
jgi:hypothetical protein